MIHLHPDKIEAGLRESLRRLGLDYVDLYLAHSPTAYKVSGMLLLSNRRDNGENANNNCPFEG